MGWWALGRICLRQPPSGAASNRLGAWRRRGEGSAAGDICPPPRLPLDKCNVGLKAGFTPAVSQAGPFQPPPRVAEERGGFRGGGHRPPPPPYPPPSPTSPTRSTPHPPPPAPL